MAIMDPDRGGSSSAPDSQEASRELLSPKPVIEQVTERGPDWCCDLPQAPQQASGRTGLELGSAGLMPFPAGPSVSLSTG